MADERGELRPGVAIGEDVRRALALFGPGTEAQFTEREIERIWRDSGKQRAVVRPVVEEGISTRVFGRNTLRKVGDQRLTRRP